MNVDVDVDSIVFDCVVHTWHAQMSAPINRTTIIYWRNVIERIFNRKLFEFFIFVFQKIPDKWEIQFSLIFQNKSVNAIFSFKLFMKWIIDWDDRFSWFFFHEILSIFFEL